MSEHEKHFVGLIAVPEFGCAECSAGQGPAREAIAQTYDNLTAIDWPARFRAAADAVDAAKLDELDGFNLRMSALWLESPDLPRHVVEAIGRALLGQGEQ